MRVLTKPSMSRYTDLKKNRKYVVLTKPLVTRRFGEFLASEISSKSEAQNLVKRLGCRVFCENS